VGTEDRESEGGSIAVMYDGETVEVLKTDLVQEAVY
jgi:hypothetical protein